MLSSSLLVALAVSSTAPRPYTSHPHTSVSILRSAQPACPTEPLPTTTIAGGVAVGAFPLWMRGGSFRWPYPPSYGAYTRPYGWAYKTLFISSVSFKGRVTLRGGSLSGGPPLYFIRPRAAHAGAHAHVEPTASPRLLRRRPIVVLFPRRCLRVEAWLLLFGGPLAARTVENNIHCRAVNESDHGGCPAVAIQKNNSVRSIVVVAIILTAITTSIIVVRASVYPRPASVATSIGQLRPGAEGSMKPIPLAHGAKIVAIPLAKAPLKLRLIATDQHSR